MRCPICRANVESATDTTAIQLRTVELNDNLHIYHDLRKKYPCGCKLFNGEKLPADHELFECVQDALRAVNARDLDLEALRTALGTRLTIQQYESVFVELVKHEDLYDVLQKFDHKMTEQKTVTTVVQMAVVHMVEKADTSAILMRAGVGIVADLAYNAMNSGFLQFTANGNFVASVGIFTLFSAIEIYRWSKGDIDGNTAMINIGEHAAGTGCGLAGMVAGAAAGAAIGSIVPIVGTTIGGIIGAFVGGFTFDAAGRMIYRKLLPRKVQTEESVPTNEEVRMSPDEIAQKAADKLEIHFKHHSFGEAQRRFRRMLLQHHPDKHPNASPTEMERLHAETRDILACWTIVRQYYQDNKENRDKVLFYPNEVVHESFIEVFVLKVKNAATGAWRIARCFFDNNSMDRPVDPESEKLEQMTLYM
jgi:hypothetical protein